MPTNLTRIKYANKEEQHMRAHWELDWCIRHLNHGSFGAVLSSVKRLQRELQDEQERDPLGFYLRRYEPLLEQSRATLAQFLGAQAAGLVFVTNATAGVNAVLQSVKWEPGDELLATDHGYGACLAAGTHITARHGALMRTVTLPCPVMHEDELIEAIMAGVTARTKLVMLDHVTSATAMILPLERLIPALHERGVRVLIDGAHAPGMLPLNLEALGADYYTGNGHKWMCAPRGAAFLYIKQEHRATTHPAILSHGAKLPVGHPSKLHAEFDWVGTNDPSAWLSFGPSVDHMAALLPGGWPEIMARNTRMAREGAQVLIEKLGLEVICPESMRGSITSLRLWDDPHGPADRVLYQSPDQARLLDEFGVEAMMPQWPSHPKRLIRISAHLYNTREDYEVLARGLEVLRA